MMGCIFCLGFGDLHDRSIVAFLFFCVCGGRLIAVADAMLIVVV